MRFLFLGPPGSGKGTQGTRLAAECGIPHVSSGDLIRDHIAQGTPFGKQVEAAIAAGNFAPDSDILYWVGRRLTEPDARSGYVLDGFPRNVVQAEAFEQPLDAVIDLEIGEAELIERLAGRWVCPVCETSYHTVHHPPRVPGHCDREGAALVRRPDDEPDAVKHRLQVYRQVTQPLEAFYKAQGILLTIDATGEADAVYGRILDSLRAHEIGKFKV